MSEKSTFYLVREEILPEAIKKTIKVKEILKRGEIKTINEAVEKMGLSRSAYYKYKDFVFPFYEASREKIITLEIAVLVLFVAKFKHFCKVHLYWTFFMIKANGFFLFFHFSSYNVYILYCSKKSPGTNIL